MQFCVLQSLLTDVVPNEFVNTRLTLAGGNLPAHINVEGHLILCLSNQVIEGFCWHREFQVSVPHANQRVRMIHLYQCCDPINARYW
jgi:hypothetical protein